MWKRLKVQMIKIAPSGSTNNQSQCCLLNGAKRLSKSSGICLHEFSNQSECPKKQHLACGCSQHLPGHPRPSHVLSPTLWLPVKRMRRQWQIGLFWSLPMTGSGAAWSRAGPTREGHSHPTAVLASLRSNTSTSAVCLRTFHNVLPAPSHANKQTHWSCCRHHGLIWPCLPILM